MPESDGRLSKDELAKVVKWFEVNQKGDVLCPICKSKEWTIGAHLVQPMTTTGPNVLFQGVAYPQVMIMSPCGYTYGMNAVIMGVLSPKTGAASGTK